MQRGMRVLGGRFCKYRPILRAQAAFAHARNVSAQLRLYLVEIDLADVSGREFEHERREVVVGIDQRSLFQERLGASDEFRVGIFSEADILKQRTREDGGTNGHSGLLEKSAARRQWRLLGWECRHTMINETCGNPAIESVR